MGTKPCFPSSFVSQHLYNTNLSICLSQFTLPGGGGSVIDIFSSHKEGKNLCEAGISYNIYLYRDSCSPCLVSMLRAGASPERNRDTASDTCLLT